MNKLTEQYAPACLCELMAMVIRQANQIEELKMDVTQLAEDLKALKVQINKATSEIVAKSAALQTALDAAIAAGNAVPQDVENALNDLRSSVQTLDDLNPDEVIQEAQAESPQEPV